MTRPFKSKQTSNTWRRFAAPMLMASLALHGALLLVPTAASNEADIPPPDFEQDNITITRVPPTAAPSEPSAATAVTSTPVNGVGKSSTPAQPAAPAPAAVAVQPASGRGTTPVPAQSHRNRPGQAAEQSPSSASQPVPNLNAAAPTTQPPPPNSSLPLNPVERQPFSPTIYQRLLAHAQSLTLPTSQINQLAARLTGHLAYSAQNTSLTEYNANLAQWVEAVKQVPGQSNLWNEVYEKPMSIEHYHRVCLNPAPHSAVVGAVVSPSGQLQGEPALLQSTGYGFLNDVVLAAIKEYSFPAAGEQKAYTIDAALQIDHGDLECLRPYPRPTTARAQR